MKPSLLVVKHRRAGGFGKFLNVSVMRDDYLQLIAEAHGGLSDCAALRAFLPGRSLPAPDTGGRRHLAAAQFVHDQRDTIALVASMDGFFMVFAWSEDLQMVHAHKIDVLLL